MFVEESGAAGQWLMEHRREMDQGECGWLEALGAFDADREWAVDGQMSCVDWLRWKTKMARVTCYEKVDLAHQLSLRPMAAQAFRDGTISYLAAWLICRMEDPDEATDEAVVRVAQRGTVRQVEHLVRHYEQLADQERPPGDPDLHRGVRVRPLEDGWMRVEATLAELEAAELIAALEAFAAVVRRSAQADDGGAGAAVDDGGDYLSGPDDSGSPEQADESARADDDAGVGPEGGESARADDSGAGDRGWQWRANQAEALVDLARVALAHADGAHAAGDDRYLVHLVATEGRAVLVRDCGHCRFPRCERRIVNVHHRASWEIGGLTDVENLVCNKADWPRATVISGRRF